MIDFLIVILVQLVFFLVHAFMVGEQRNILRYLIKGMFIGLPFGIAFDLIIGNYLGVYDYHTGFDPLFLIVNGVLSYGFMMANVLLLHNHSIHHMYLWSMALGLVYEVANHFFPVWIWTFNDSLYLTYAAVVFAGYAGLAWLMMFALRIMYRAQFKIVPF